MLIVVPHDRVVGLADGPARSAGLRVLRADEELRWRIPKRPTSGYHETGFSMAYSSYISWDGGGFVPNEVSPSRAFDRVFENRGNRWHQSILDRVKDRAARLSRTVSASDKERLDGYLTSVREVETRVDRARNAPPEDVRERMRLMCDIVALAFQTDRTRVASLLRQHRWFTQGQRGNDEYVLAIDTSNGKKVWETLTGKSFRERRGHGPWPCRSS